MLRYYASYSLRGGGRRCLAWCLVTISALSCFARSLFGGFADFLGGLKGTAQRRTGTAQPTCSCLNCFSP